MLDGEEQLIKNAIDGEASAFGLLYDRYQPKIYRFIYLKVSHREEAEDLTHQVFLSAWEKIENFQFKENSSYFSGWLYQIARNKIIDHYRTRKNNSDISKIQIIDEKNRPENAFEKNLNIKKVKHAISLLNANEQDVIIMRFVEELSPKEISKALDKSEVSVRIIQHRAIKKLKNILNNKPESAIL